MHLAAIGVDVGTSSTKGVAVDAAGRVLRAATREHAVSRPRAGHVEMDGAVWWQEFVDIAGELTAPGDLQVVSVGVSGMGPCTLLTDESGTPLRPAILYGVDTRASDQIRELDEELGRDAILQRCGSALSSQAVGPKLAWVRDHEPEVWSRARRMFMPASWLLYQLTGEYLLDHHSASQCTPLYDRHAGDWYRPWAQRISPDLHLPGLRWADEIGATTRTAVAGIPAGTPVVTGTIDAWAEAVSVGAVETGDLMLMYGTTMFLVATVDEPLTSPSMWGTAGAFAGTHSLAGGMATSGAITAWLRELTGGPSYDELTAQAADVGVGADGLVMLPYFAGERTPLQDPQARGVIAGLTLSHTRGHLYRAALEATAFGVRHNVEVMREAGARVSRVVAAGGGTQGGLWTQIVSDATGLDQAVPEVTVGASYGAAYLAARQVWPVDIRDWNPPSRLVSPDPAASAEYDDLYPLYRSLYDATRDIAHTLATRQTRTPEKGST